MTQRMEKLLIFAKSKWLMEIGQRVNISPYLTHLSDWVIGEIIEVENNPNRGIFLAAKDSLGRIFWGEQDYFNPIIDDQEGDKLKDVICERIRQLEAGEAKTISNEQVFAEIQNRYGF